MMHDFYNTPVQVVFADIESTKDNINWCGGIAFRDEVICGCCGGVFEIADLLSITDEIECDPIFEYDDWMNIEEEIRGDELPIGLMLLDGKIVLEEEEVYCSEDEDINSPIFNTDPFFGVDVEDIDD